MNGGLDTARWRSSARRGDALAALARLDHQPVRWSSRPSPRRGRVETPVRTRPPRAAPRLNEVSTRARCAPPARPPTRSVVEPTEPRRGRVETPVRTSRPRAASRRIRSRRGLAALARLDQQPCSVVEPTEPPARSRRDSGQDETAPRCFSPCEVSTRARCARPARPATLFGGRADRAPGEVASRPQQGRDHPALLPGAGGPRQPARPSSSIVVPSTRPEAMSVTIV